MRRSPATRFFAALFAPWLAVVMAEPAALHECAMHSGHAIHAAAAAAAAMAHQHAMAASGAGDVPAHAPSRDAAARYCTCLGGCCAATPVAMPVAPELAWIPSSVRDASRTEPADQVVPVAPGHLLPFANGPPAPRV